MEVSIKTHIKEMFDYPVVEDYNDLERYQAYKDLQVVALGTIGLSALGCIG